MIVGFRKCTNGGVCVMDVMGNWCVFCKVPFSKHEDLKKNDEISNIEVLKGSPYSTITWIQNGRVNMIPAMGATKENAIDYILGLKKFSRK